MKCMTAVISRPAGWPGSISSRACGLSRTLAGSRTSAWTKRVVPPSPSRSRACAATMGSLSTYRTRAPGLAFWMASCVLPLVGRPDPMSMNWRTPRSAIHRAARWWKPRLAQAASDSSGISVRMCSAAARSTGKLLVPPR